MSDEYDTGRAAPDNPAVAAAMSRLDQLDSAPLETHAAVFEDVRSELRSALDAD